MRILILLLLMMGSAVADPAPRPMPWLEIGRHFYSPLQVRMWGPDTLADPQPWTGTYIRVNVSDPYPSPELQPGTWYTVDLRPLGVGYEPGTTTWIGADVAFLSGIGIISGGNNPPVNASGQSALPDFHVTFARADDETANCAKYQMQTSLGYATAGGGARSATSTMVPLKDGQYKFCFWRSTVGNWPAAPGYGLNLTLQWWGVKK